MYGSDVDNDILDDGNQVVVTVPNLNPNVADLNPDVAVSMAVGRVPCARTDIDGIIVSGIKHGKKSRK